MRPANGFVEDALLYYVYNDEVGEEVRDTAQERVWDCVASARVEEAKDKIWDLMYDIQEGL